MAETGGTIPTGEMVPMGVEDAWVAAGRILVEEEALTEVHEGPTVAAGTIKSAKV
jgi:predicted NUDIX family NTP pyrophosphohydrolase